MSVGYLVLRRTSRGYVTTSYACLVIVGLHVLKEAAWKLPVDGGARGMPRDPRNVHVALLEVEPTFLARVHKATWQNADVKMQKLGRRARGSHA